MALVNLNRWKKAQNSEKKLWEDMASTDYVEEHAKYYKKKRDIILEEASKHMKVNKRTKFLQIGCACLDVVNYITIGQKYSIDPLADFFKKKYKEVDYKDTRLIKGVGENLPYPDKFFDIVLLANVLDHAYNPKKVLSEVSRVLKDSGVFYFENHFYQKSFLILAKFYGLFQKVFLKKDFNINHPYMFSLKELKKLLLKDFLVLNEKLFEDIEKEIYDLEDLRKYLKKEKLTRRLPAYFGVYGIINYTAFCKKKI
jgi:ubiquinone/menaquinone biosynthesis C-methylase UbiE